MRKIICLLLFSIPLLGYSQQNSESLSNDAFQLIEKSKSGNYKDVLFSFMQATLKSTDTNEKKIELNSTLFKILADNNKDLFAHYTRNQIKFIRNFQLNLKLDLDNQFKSKGFTGGVTIALVNERDRKFVDYTKTLLQVNYDTYLTVLHDAQKEQIKAGIDADEVTEASEIILNELLIPDTKKALVTALKTSINTKIAANPSFNTLKDSEGNSVAIQDSDSFVSFFHGLKNQLEKHIDANPLWTLSADGSTNTEGKFNKASLSSIFLKGNKEAWNEIDIRGKFTYADTLSTVHLPRTAFNAKAGMNFKIGKSTNGTSFFELKFSAEYNKILNNALDTERNAVIYADTDIRLRISEDLWIPLTIKYDTEKANFLGFLNVTYNFEQKP